MTATLVILNLVGWSLAALLLALLMAAIRINRALDRQNNDLQARCLELENTRDNTEQDNTQSSWALAECDRLRAKCEAICRAARRLKGRGMATTECHPIHRF